MQPVITVLRSSWPLFLGILLLMVGNGMQGTLLGIRGSIERIDTFHMSIVMSAYFAGFLLGSRLAPDMIRRVGHVRVFAALASLISAIMILYAAIPDWVAWAILRALIGFCFAGVYIAAESWLNAASTNETRGQTLSVYMIMQAIGIVTGQYLMTTADPAGYILFVIPSVLISLSFAPILLTVTSAPPFESTKALSFVRLYRASPLGCVGIFLMGGVFSGLFGMAAVWGATAGLSVAEISVFVAAIYVGGLFFQYPVGWVSDRFDRRILILSLALFGALGMALAVLLDPGFTILVIIAMCAGGVANPLYSLLIAYTNDYLDNSDMAAASAGLMFINGAGAIFGPLVTGWLMQVLGDMGFFLYLATLFALLAGYAAWRLTRRPGPAPPTGSFAVLSPSARAQAVETVLIHAPVTGDAVAQEPVEDLPEPAPEVEPEPETPPQPAEDPR